MAYVIVVNNVRQITQKFESFLEITFGRIFVVVADKMLKKTKKLSHHKTLFPKVHASSKEKVYKSWN